MKVKKILLSDSGYVLYMGRGIAHIYARCRSATMESAISHSIVLCENEMLIYCVDFSSLLCLTPK